MDTVDPQRFLFSFVFVLGLIGLLAMVLKRYGHWLQNPVLSTFINTKIKKDASNVEPVNNRLSIVEMRYLDSKRKLVLIRRDKMEHLLLLAEDRETLIESRIASDER